MQRYRLTVFTIPWVLVFVIGIGNTWAGAMPNSRVSDIRNTKHNFSSFAPPDIQGNGDTRSVKASEEAEICVFCHTPHGANVAAAPGPLWNRNLSTATYDTYNSGSLDATGDGIALDQPSGISKLCLSCHDGTIAIGSVRNRSGSGGFQASAIGMTGTEADGTMPGGPYGENSGFTRRIGTDLTNDHPISFTYDTALANLDGEMRDPALEPGIGNRSSGVSPHIPLEDGQVQCSSCHDPHIRDAADPTRNIKFLRLNRFQRISPINTTFNEANDIICMACHDKDGWVGSAHATDFVANEIYTDAAADRHEFPRGSAVWETACLSCHDTHTVQGSRRLLREGVDGPIGASGEKQGGNAAIEETCYACHSKDGGTLVGQGGVNFEVPDIKTDFNRRIRMPISNDDQVANREMHDIGTGSNSVEGEQRGKDFIESQASLGKVSMGGSLANRHVECTDCHNPHRVVRRRLFNEDHLSGRQDAAGTHAHNIADITAETPYTTHNNLASGVLRGAWGVEPVYADNDFMSEPSDFTIKRGDPGNSMDTSVTAPYVTREYQICLKCHSNYAYDTPPNLRGGPGFTSNSTTLTGTNGMTQYTNQAREFNSPVNHRGQQSLGADGGADLAYNTNNHRSWHPVMRETGRTPDIRRANANNWTTPFSAAVGTQTMYCSDCHGSNTLQGTVDPDPFPGDENGAAWGPHGSNNDFLLKGPWSAETGGGLETLFSPGTENHLCFKCHDFDQYANYNPGQTQSSGFGAVSSQCNQCGVGIGAENYHTFHAGTVPQFRCSFCHVAVPHGWKNKAFLVNLNDVGPEAGLAPGTQVRYDTSGLGVFPAGTYTKGPYYNRAVLKIRNFARSGEWTESNCGSSGAPGNGLWGVDWMVSPDEGCQTPP